MTKGGSSAEVGYAKFDPDGRLVQNTERWADIAGESAKWRGRYRALARHIPDGASVVEFGCSDMALRGLLPPGCRYQPSDLVSRSPECWVIDLDGSLPEPGGHQFDVAVFSGVLEYVRDFWRALDWAAGLASFVLFSYATTDNFADLGRRHRSYGWFNHLSHADVLSGHPGLAELIVEPLGRWNSQNLYRARRTDALPPPRAGRPHPP